MADDSKDKKRTVIVSLLAFLLIGGGVFLFFIIQGSNDLTGPKNANFHYGSVVRQSMAPFFRYFGLADDEKTPKTVHEARLSRFLDKQASENLDMSGWMNKSPEGAGAASPRDSGARSSASARAPSSVPRMSGGGGGGMPSGGGSQSSGGGSRFEGGPSRGNTRISASQSGGLGAGSGKGTLNALRGTQAMLNNGLRSGSAMTAKSSWDKSFGVGTTGRSGGGGSGGAGGALSSGNKGLAGLDTIKSGEITNLKTTDPAAANAPAASPPKLEEDKKDAASDVSKGLASGLTSKGAAALTGGGGTPAASQPKGTPAEPPADIKQKTEESGYYCKTACCADAAGYKFMAKDDSITYQKQGDVWTATFKGEYTLGDKPGGEHYANYEQTFVIAAGSGELTPISSGSCVTPTGPCPDLSIPGNGPAGAGTP